jgi:hypothetical protein
MPNTNDGPNAADLTSVGQAKAWIPGFVNNPSPDATIQKLVTSVSRDVVRMVGASADRNSASPTFGMNTLNSQIQFVLTLDGNGSDVLFPPVRPLIVINRLLINGYAPPINTPYGVAGVCIENDGYSIAFQGGFGASGTSGTVGWPAGGAGGRFPMGRRNILLDCLAGYGLVVDGASPPAWTTPDDLEVAVLQIVALNYMRRDRVGLDSENIQGTSSTSYSKVEYPLEALAILKKYTRVPMVGSA